MGLELLFLVLMALAFCAGVGVGYFFLAEKAEKDTLNPPLDEELERGYDDLANYYDEEYDKWKEEHDKNLYYTSFEYEEAQLNLAESEAEYDA